MGNEAIKFVSDYTGVPIVKLSLDMDLHNDIEWGVLERKEDPKWLVEDLLEIFVLKNKIPHKKRYSSWIGYIPRPFSFLFESFSYPLINFENIRIRDMQEMYEGQYWNMGSAKATYPAQSSAAE